MVVHLPLPFFVKDLSIIPLSSMKAIFVLFLFLSPWLAKGWDWIISFAPDRYAWYLFESIEDLLDTLALEFWTNLRIDPFLLFIDGGSVTILEDVFLFFGFSMIGI